MCIPRHAAHAERLPTRALSGNDAMRNDPACSPTTNPTPPLPILWLILMLGPRQTVSVSRGEGPLSALVLLRMKSKLKIQYAPKCVWTWEVGIGEVGIWRTHCLCGEIYV
jgi:hypothetical protein